jgi:predicted transposase YdaD
VSHPYDATTKALIETRPGDWLPLLGFPAGLPVRLIDADLATVSAAADKVVRVGAGRRAWLLHLEFQAGRDAGLVARARLYNVLLDHRHGLPVLSVLILLRPDADGPELTGVEERALPTGERSLQFRYRVVRVRELPVETVLNAPPGVLPLAPLAAVRQDDLPAVVRRMEARVEREATPAEAAVLWSATFILMGLRYSREFAGQLLRGVRAMRESVTWQMIFEEGEEKGKAEGRAEGVREMLLLQGAKRFGPPDAGTGAALAAVSDPDVLRELSSRLLDVGGWQELLAAVPRPRRRKRRTP